MAEVPKPVTQAIERVREELTCAVCQELFDTPKTLSCLHTFCEGCLSDSEKARRKRSRMDSSYPKDGEIECPQCRALSEPTGGIKNITTNFTYSNLVEHVKIHDKVLSDDGLRCGICKEDVEAPAVAFCYDCRAALCDFCHKMHQRSKDMGKHNFCTLNEIKEAPRVDIPPVKRAHFCEKHKEPLRWYCYTCSAVICRDCTVSLKDHRNHSYEYIGEIINSEKEEIVSHIEPLTAMLEEVVKGTGTIESEIEKLKTIQKRRLAKIDKAIDESIEMLEERRRALRVDSDKIFHHKSKNVGLQLERLQHTSAAIISAREFAAMTLEKGSDVEVLMYKKELVARCDTLKEMHAQLPFEVMEDDNVQFVYEPACLQTLGKLCEAPCAPKCYAEGTGLVGPMQGVDSKFTVVAHGSKDQRLVHGGGACSVEVSCTPETTCQLETLAGTASDNDDGTYTISYSPQFPGSNHISVKFEDVHIKESPFEVNVVRNFANVIPEPYVFTIPNASPWGITMISEDELAISASDCLVHIYTIQGTETETIRSNFTRPYGITTDSEGYLWVTDREAHNVQKFQRAEGRSGKWEKVFQFGQRGVNAGQFSHPRGIAVHPDTGHVYISDMKNNRIQIFKPDSSLPRYHAQFGSPGKNPGLFNLPAGITFDRDGHLIVCDDHNCRLQVFDAEGRFLHTLGTTSAQKGLLCSPIGVASDVYGRYIVTEFGSHCVSFLSPEGDILSCVRTIGKGFGQFVHPRGVTVNPTGYIYVADNENMRIVRF